MWLPPEPLVWYETNRMLAVAVVLLFIVIMILFRLKKPGFADEGLSWSEEELLEEEQDTQDVLDLLYLDEDEEELS
jgi:hypothetical protein